MQKVFEASGYNFTIITPNDSEPHFISQEVAKGFTLLKLTNQFKTGQFNFKKHQKFDVNT